MKIIIEYDSCWQNSVLDGSNNQPLPKRGRNFVATSESLKIERKPITKDTVMGVLCRLIGDQKKLFQSRQDPDYYFKLIEDKVTFKPVNEEIINEVIYIRNTKTNTNPRHSISGVIRDNTSLFYSSHAPQLWSILYLELDKLLNFILQDKKLEPILRNVILSQLVHRVQQIQALKNYTFLRDELAKLDDNIAKIEKELLELEVKLRGTIGKAAMKIEKKIQSKNEIRNKHKDKRSKLENDTEKMKSDEKYDAIIKHLSNEFPNQSYIEINGTVKPIRIYSAALYLQLKRMEKSGIDVGALRNTNGKIQGFSVKEFHGRRDFLSPFSTGGKAKNQGNPFKDRTGQALTKASGKLEVNIDVDRKKARDIKRRIENAGVSSFYLGKKGLAYVRDIDTRS